MERHVIQTPLARARGLGSAKFGAGHWWAQRVTAVALVPLTLWFLASFAWLIRADHAAFVDWLRSPLNTVLVSMFVIVMFYHLALGLRTIAEDYLHDDIVRVPVLVSLPIMSLFLVITSIIAIVRVLS